MTINWYSISISLESDDTTIFDGYFSVDNTTNLVISFYETINGSTNFNNSILIPTGTGTVTGSYLGFTVYETGNAFYDNAYLSTWLQFDTNGVIINSMSAYPQYNLFNLWASNSGDESVNNIGIVGNNELISSNFTIIPISDPSSITCFKEGTKILTDRGYIPIQDLRKGDLVKTLKHDFKEIDMIGKKEIYHPAIKERIKDQLYQCSQSEYPEIFEPLVITGCHSILVENSSTLVNAVQIEQVKEVNGGIYLTDDKLRLPACVDEKTTVYETPGNYTIYHLALENDDYFMNYGIYANGLLVETCSKRYLSELSNMNLIES